jgi:hypothetical protein
MRLEITAPAEVLRGDPVPISLRLINTTARPITVYLQGRPTAFDIVVSNAAGMEVWRRLAGQTITAILGIRTLEPKETVTFEDLWPQRDQAGRPVPAGRYNIVGVLPSEGDSLVTAPVPVEVRPAR